MYRQTLALYCLLGYNLFCTKHHLAFIPFQVSAKDMSDHILKLTVIDAGRTKRKAEIGHITYPLKDLEIGDGTEQQLFKMDLEKVSISCDI